MKEFDAEQDLMQKEMKQYVGEREHALLVKIDEIHTKAE